MAPGTTDYLPFVHASTRLRVEVKPRRPGTAGNDAAQATDLSSKDVFPGAGVWLKGTPHNRSC
eukprot:CAMPEP_0114163396 /NCGR_PEP_ID=MMETSP0043_2-20121206/30066_1 /TAXON_ID=464988 /ORGANISM="Hemiselmis andersenii, Strain CCMP644" /LENGTH=62 /DNA_ID=CAMNT_0001259895 /DNA_START=110 /DNA_END=295 /DNA_ORIENTATION=-